MIPIAVVIALFVLHFVADWLLQTNWMATNKSRWNQSREGLWALTLHVIVYSLAFFAAFDLTFAAITFATHWLTDAVTSKYTTKYWFVDFYVRPSEEKDRYGYYQRFGAYPYYANFDPQRRAKFFKVIGFDQLLHYCTLVGTWWLLYGA